MMKVNENYKRERIASRMYYHKINVDPKERNGVLCKSRMTSTGIVKIVKVRLVFFAIALISFFPYFLLSLQFASI